LFFSFLYLKHLLFIIIGAYPVLTQGSLRLFSHLLALAHGLALYLVLATGADVALHLFFPPAQNTCSFLLDHVCDFLSHLVYHLGFKLFSRSLLAGGPDFIILLLTNIITIVSKNESTAKQVMHYVGGQPFFGDKGILSPSFWQIIKNIFFCCLSAWGIK
jgi:hypothetical protein